MNDVNCNTSVKPLNTVQKIDRCLSADFESPFSRRSLSTMEKIKIASADLLFGYKEVLSVKNKLLSELINDRFFGYCTYPNALENVVKEKKPQTIPKNKKTINKSKIYFSISLLLSLFHLYHLSHSTQNMS